MESLPTSISDHPLSNSNGNRSTGPRLFVEQQASSPDYDLAINGVTESISFVVPVFNESPVLSEFYHQLKSFLAAKRFVDYEIIFVNDGSTDSSLDLLLEFSSSDPTLKVVNLARNFGKEVALTAGLDWAGGDAIILIDADLQHPFAVIEPFIQHWRIGHDVVFAIQRNRQQGILRRTLSKLYHRLIQKLSGESAANRGAGDFRLLSRRAVDKLKRMREHHRVMKGLYPAVGLRQKGIAFEAAARPAGESRWRMNQLINLALDGITATSTAPLRLATLIGLATVTVAMGLATLTAIKTIFWGEAVAGYPSLIIVVLFLGSVQLICLGILGEYLGRIFNETKNRPLYFLEDVYIHGQPSGTEEPEMAVYRRAS